MDNSTTPDLGTSTISSNVFSNKPEYVIRIYRGNYDYIPEQKQNQLKIFLSSTFADFQHERNYLIGNVYDELRKFCLEYHQIDFIMIDMRWGITDEICNQNLTMTMCLDEIKNCQRESIGPSFVALLSHRYGNRFLKEIINEDEFELIRKESMKIPYKNITNLLDYCYELDENELNKRHYRLKSVRSVLEGLGLENDSEKEWNIIEETLNDYMRQAAEKNLKNGTFNETQRNSYFISITEQEIVNGILQLSQEDANDRALVFYREIEGLQNIQNSVNSHRYVDSFKGADAYLDNLKGKLNAKLSENNRINLKVHWDVTNGLSIPYTQDMNNYLTEFGNSFKKAIYNLIERNINKRKDSSKLIEYTCDPEILHHAHFCNKLVKNCLPRQKLMEKISAYLTDQNNNKPFIITGESGSGKSSLIANTIKNSRHDNNVFIVRFMGTSRESSNVRLVLKSILKQLDNIFILDDEIEDIDDFESIFDLKEYFLQHLLDVAAKNPTQNIIILLDSVDQLHEQDYYLDWMICDLPKNVKFIYTVLSKHGGILDRIKAKIPFSNSNYMTVEPFNFDESKQVLQNWLSESGRKLSESQWTVVDGCLKSTSELFPLHLKLLLDITIKWSSLTKIDDQFKNCTNTKNTIKYLFAKHEQLNGKLLFSRFIFYLTLFKYNGISENEMEDILSIDDDVLTSVFEHHHPPNRRFPNALWIKIKSDFKEYITHKEVDDAPVMAWFHRAFIEASEEYYQDLFKPSPNKDAILMNVIDYFTEKWNEKRSNGEKGEEKPFKYSEKLVKKLGEQGSKAYRHTRTQQIEFEYKEDGKVVSKMTKGYNKRKLNEFLYVVTLLNDKKNKIDILMNHIYFNYEFMHAKAELRNMDFVIDMHKMITDLKIEIINENAPKALIQNTTDLHKLSAIYKDNYIAMQQYPDGLSFEVLSRLKNRSELVENFAKPSGLILRSSYISGEKMKDIYRAGKDFIITKMHWTITGPYLCIEMTDENEMCKVEVINYSDTKVLGSFNLKNESKYVSIILTPKARECQRLVDFDGCVYFANGNDIYVATLDSSISLVRKYGEDIKALVVMNPTNLLIVFEKKFEIFNTKAHKAKPLGDMETLGDDVYIRFIETNLNPTTVYSHDSYNSIGQITVLIGFSNKKIGIYHFDTKLQTLVHFCDIVSDELHFGMRPTIFIDQDYSIDKLVESKNESKVDGKLFQFAIADEEHSSIHVIEIKSQSEYTMSEFNESMLNITDEDDVDSDAELDDAFYEDTHKKKLRLEGFQNNKVILKISKGRWINEWRMYIYDLNKKKCIENTGKNCNRLYSIYNHKHLILQYSNEFTIYSPEENEVKEVTKIQLPHFKALNKAKYKEDCRIKNGMIMWRKPDGTSVVQIDYLSEVSKEPIDDTWSTKIVLSMVDDEHQLVRIVRDDTNNFEVALINVTKQTIIKSFSLNVKTNHVEILGCNEGYLVIYDTKSATLLAYFIEYNVEHNSCNFTEILNKNIQVSESWSYYANQCFFNKDTKNKFIVSLCHTNEKHIQVCYIEHNLGQNDCKYDTYKINTETVELEHEEMYCALTASNKYLILWQFKKELLYYIDIMNNKITINKVMDREIEELVSVPETDDCVIILGKSIIYLELQVVDDLKCDLKSYEKIYESAIYSLKVNKQTLAMKKDEYIEVHELAEIRNKNFDKAVTLKKRVRDYILSTDRNYIVGKTNNFEIYLVRRHDLQEIACLPVNMDFVLLMADKRSVVIEINEKILTFFIYNKL